LKESDSHAAAEIIRKLRDDGIAFVEDYFDADTCANYIAKLEEIFEYRYSNDIFCGNREYQVLYNYFQGRPDMFGLLFQGLTDQIMCELIDQDYVLISPAARNRQIRSDLEQCRQGTSGVGWHVDTRFVGASPRALQPSPIYFSFIALDDFTYENGATFYVPGSHKWYRRPEDRNAQLDSQAVQVKKGTLGFFDAALWHRVGEPSTKSRWSVFNMFGPWFMKPYFRFYEMFRPQEMETFPPKIRQLLHWDSLPPKDHAESTITLRRVRDSNMRLPVE